MENSQLLCELLTRYPALSSCKEQILRAAEMMLEVYRHGGKILVLGNGGSASDSEHIVGELMKGFMKKRDMSEPMKEKFRAKLGERADRLVESLQCAIPAISLPSQCGVLSAFANDVDPELVYAQLVMGYGRKGDLLIAISTSGNSKNAVAAVEVASVLGVRTVALTGGSDSALSAICDLTVKVPESETFKVQELHLPVYHYLCAFVENEAFEF